MHRADPRLSRLSAATALAFALVAAPAAAVQITSGEVFIKLPPGASASGKGDHKEEIEVLSYSWGASQSGSARAGPEYEWKVEEGESAPPAPGGVRVAAGDIDGSARASDGKEKITIHGRPTESAAAPGKRTPPTVTLKRGSMAAPASGSSGSLTAIVTAGQCRAGARYPTMTVGTGEQAYELKDVRVTSCAPASVRGGSRPVESMALNFTKIEYRQTATADGKR